MGLLVRYATITCVCRATWPQDELLTRIAERIGLDPVPVIDNPPEDETAEPDQDG